MFATFSKLSFWSKAIVFSLLAATLFFSITPLVYAHGERSQEPFLRMRTIQWYDVTWSTDKLSVNEELIVRGKFKVSEDWPDAAARPDTVFLNISIPGPVFVRTKSSMNGVNMVNSTSLKLGRDYEWEVHLKARHPGRWHVHSLLNVKGAGPIVGPGSYVEITGDNADFVNEIRTITGDVIDLDDYGLKRNISWHLLWGVLGAVWLAYWLRRPSLFVRYKAVKKGKGDKLITRADRFMAVTMLVLSIGITIVGYQLAESLWPETIALQSAKTRVEPLEIAEERIKVKLIKGIYRLPGRSMEMKLEVTNLTEEAVRLGEFTTATVRFINPGIGLVDDAAKNYPEHLMAEHGLTIDDDSLIMPGETRVMKVVAQDAAWETERLGSLVYDPDSRFGGLLFFYDETNKRYISSVGGILSPRFI